MGDIAYQNKDVTAKVMAEALKGKSLAPFGIHQLKIVDILPTILPVIESNELRLDNLFLLSDGSIGIMDYESAYNQENFVKYINYIARVIKRYAINHELDRIKQIKMIVIYTADVDHAEAVYDLGGIVLKIEPTFLVEADTKAQYDRIRQRIDAGERLTDEELMEMEKGMEKGIQALIEDNREDGVSEERIVEKLQKRFSMDRGKAEAYLQRFTRS